MDMHYQDLGTLAYHMASGILSGNYVTPFLNEKEYIERLFAECHLVDPHIKKSYVQKYVQETLPLKNEDSIIGGRLATIACTDLMLRATSDAANDLHMRTVDVMETVSVSRGALEALVRELYGKGELVA